MAEHKAQPQPFWTDEPAILFHRDYLNQLWPNKEMTTEQRLNTITRLIIILSVLGYLLTVSLIIPFVGMLTLAILAVLYHKNKNGDTAARHGNGGSSSKTTSNHTQHEGFINNVTNPRLYNATREQFTTPTPANPLMNVLLPETHYNPRRKNAAPSFNPAVEEDINEATKQFVSSSIDLNACNLLDNNREVCDRPPNHTTEKAYNQLFGTLGDNQMFEASMRNFYSTSNTRVPNDQSAFAKFCYGEMTSCKEGNEFACGRINSRLGSIAGA